MSRPHLPLIPRLLHLFDPAPLPENRDLCWFYQGPVSVSAPGPLKRSGDPRQRRRKRAGDGNYTRHANIYMKPRVAHPSISYLGGSRSLPLALWLHYCKPADATTEFRYKNLCPQAITSPEGVQFYCANPWHNTAVPTTRPAPIICPDMDASPLDPADLALEVERWCAEHPNGSLDDIYQVFPVPSEYPQKGFSAAVRLADLPRLWRERLKDV